MFMCGYVHQQTGEGGAGGGTALTGQCVDRHTQCQAVSILARLAFQKEKCRQKKRKV